MKLVLAEKPSVAQSIAKVLGAAKREDGYLEGKSKGYFCSNRGCRFALWKNNRYFASIGKSMTSATAQKLLGSGKVKLKNCKSERTGNTFDATVFMEVSEDGKTKFSMEFENGGKRK